MFKFILAFGAFGIIFNNNCIAKKDNFPPIDLLSYNVTIIPKNETVTSELELKLLTTDAIKAFSFPKKNLKITHITTDNDQLKTTMSKDTIKLSSDKLIKKGTQVKIKIHYQGKPSGIIFKQQAVLTNNDVCSWLLCHNNPADKFAFQLTLEVPEKWQVYASDKLIRKVKNQQVWSTETDTSAFLIGFFMGKAEVTHKQFGDKKLTLIDQGLEQKQRQAIFDKTIDAIKYFQKISGISLPTKAYTQIIVPGDIAQEKSSFSILGMDHIKPMFSNPEHDWVIVHEVGHQWWGKLLTCQDWPHLWLHEGIVKFLVATYKERTWGKEVYNREINTVKKYHHYTKLKKFDVPLTYSGKYPTFDIKREIIYGKGAVFMSVLRHKLGEEKFWKALKDYTLEHQGHTVTSKDFQQSFESSSKMSLKDEFSKWVY